MTLLERHLLPRFHGLPHAVPAGVCGGGIDAELGADGGPVYLWELAGVDLDDKGTYLGGTIAGEDEVEEGSCFVGGGHFGLVGWGLGCWLRWGCARGREKGGVCRWKL